MAVFSWWLIVTIVGLVAAGLLAWMVWLLVHSKESGDKDGISG